MKVTVKTWDELCKIGTLETSETSSSYFPYITMSDNVDFTSGMEKSLQISREIVIVNGYYDCWYFTADMYNVGWQSESKIIHEQPTRLISADGYVFDAEDIAGIIFINAGKRQSEMLVTFKSGVRWGLGVSKEDYTVAASILANWIENKK